MDKKLVIAAAAAALVGGQILGAVFPGEALAQSVVRVERELTPPEAGQVAQRMNLTVDEAVRQGLMQQLENGNFLVTESGAALLAANGVSLGAFAGATPLQITGMVALALGLTFIGESLVDEQSSARLGDETVAILKLLHEALANCLIHRQVHALSHLPSFWRRQLALHAYDGLRQSFARKQRAQNLPTDQRGRRRGNHQLLVHSSFPTFKVVV